MLAIVASMAMNGTQRNELTQPTWQFLPCVVHRLAEVFRKHAGRQGVTTQAYELMCSSVLAKIP